MRRGISLLKDRLASGAVVALSDGGEENDFPRIKPLAADKLPADALRREEKRKKELVEESLLTR